MHRKPFDPYLDMGLKGYIVNMARRNYWRVPSYIGLDDLIQDGFLAYAICKARYGDKVENRAHFMALFKRVYFSRIVDAANKKSESDGSLYVVEIDGKKKAWMPYAQALANAKAAEKAGHDAVVRPGYSEVKVKDLYPEVDETSALEFLAGGEVGEAEIRLTMATASNEIKMFMDDLDQGYFAGRYPRKKRNGKRETNNEFFNRMLKTTGIDYESEMRNLFAC